MTKETFETFARKAVVLMTLALNEQSKHQETVDIFMGLEERTDAESGNWLFALLHFYAGTDELHDRLITAAHNADKPSTVMEKYRLAVNKFHTDKSKIGTYLHLQHWLAALLWSHRSREEKEAALDMWEEIMNMEVPEGSDEEYMVLWARSLSAPKFAISLLDSAKAAGLSTPLNPAAESYAARLEKLTHGDPDYVHGTFDDVRISLARLHHLAGDDARVKDIVREIMRTGLQLFGQQELDTLKDGLTRIAVLLQAMDDDVNAIAAWRCFTPKAPVSSDSEAGGGGTSCRSMRTDESRFAQGATGRPQLYNVNLRDSSPSPSYFTPAINDKPGLESGIMWLLNAHTLTLEYVTSSENARYAILSHTWNKEEVTFQEIREGCDKNKEGYLKIINTCQQALKDGFDKVWIDTCCINKESSAELSESINSMWRWYCDAEV